MAWHYEPIFVDTVAASHVMSCSTFADFAGGYDAACGCILPRISSGIRKSERSDDLAVLVDCEIGETLDIDVLSN